MAPNDDKPGSTREFDKTKRHRCWCLTHNNYTDQDVQFYESLECRYLVYGREVGKSIELDSGEVRPGTPHLQMFVMFKEAKTFSAMKKLLPRVHIEPMYTDPLHASEYCKKSDPNFVERGTPPTSQEQNGAAGKLSEQEKWARINLLADQGDFDTLKAEFSKEWGLHKPKFKLARQEFLAKAVPKQLPRRTLHLWLWGEQGYGKSRYVTTLYPDVYDKDPKDDFWQNYQFQPVVKIEEVHPYVHRHLAPFIKMLCDTARFTARVKCSDNLIIRPELVIVTSNHPP